MYRCHWCHTINALPSRHGSVSSMLVLECCDQAQCPLLDHKRSHLPCQRESGEVVPPLDRWGDNLARFPLAWQMRSLMVQKGALCLVATFENQHTGNATVAGR